MQSKGFIKLVTVLIALACIWQLSFTLVTNHHESKAEEYADKAIAAEKQSPSFAEIPVRDQAFYLDSLRDVKNKYFLDSISAEKVFLGYTFKQVKEKEISLGLDLKGGMNVILQVELKDLIVALSDNSESPVLNKALAITDSLRADTPGADYISLFEKAWNKANQELGTKESLASVFGTAKFDEKITRETSDSDVIKQIRAKAEEAVASAFKVLRNRIDGFGVTQPNIQNLGASGRILIELPGVKEPDRVKKLLQGTASLEFWPTYENHEVLPGFLMEAEKVIRKINEAENTTAADSSEAATKIDSLTAQNQQQVKTLFTYLHPMTDGQQAFPGPVVGWAFDRDTAEVNRMLRLPEVQNCLPNDLPGLKLMWAQKAFDEAGIQFNLIALNTSYCNEDGSPKIDGDDIEDARTNFSERGGSPEVSMTMKREGARIWSDMTEEFAKDHRCIAIVLDGVVYSYPRVNGKIPNGVSSITGDFTIEEAEDLANVLECGKLPAPAKIVHEQVVGPTLGSQSISSGMLSFIIGFILVLVYMLLFYSKAGLVADFALLCNVLFLFGSLVSFGAVLTLPGIAGLVLTMGMAVDANVIIFERVKEEIRAGKALKSAVKDGYSNAYSAIVDGQLTTIITGIVLFFFGSGPVRGFATTLVIGILTSMFCSIFITRLIFDAMLAKDRKISFATKFTENFMQNTKVNFVKIRKKTYIISAVFMIIALGAIFFKGFSYGVDFTGGRTYVVRFDQNVDIEQIRHAAEAEFNESVEIKQFGAGSQIKITTKYLYSENEDEVQAAKNDSIVDGMLHKVLSPFFKDGNIAYDEFTSTLSNPNGIISSDKVGATIAEDMRSDAIIAVILSLLAIFLYIAIRFKNWTWGTGGVLSLVHTTLFVLGFFALFTGILPFNLDVDQTFIAAILTIIGYAINDNVVIFDRIREYRTLYPNRDLATNINQALNSTLSRTLNTSATTLVVLLAIAIFGGEMIRGFAVALCVGVIVGTYSSIFIGTPIMYDLNMKKARKEEKKLNK